MPRRLHRSCSSLLDSMRPPQRPKPVPPPPCAINTSSSSRLATARGTNAERVGTTRPFAGGAATAAAAARLPDFVAVAGDLAFLGVGEALDFAFLGEAFGVFGLMARRWRLLL